MASPQPPGKVFTTSPFTTRNDFGTQEPNIGKLAVGFSIIALTLLGNIVIVLIYLRNHKMRTATNTLVINHCLTDILLSLSDIALFYRWHAYVPHLSMEDDIFCSVTTFFDSSFKVASFLSMFCIALDKYMDFVRRTRCRITKQCMTVLISWVWLQSLLATTLEKAIFARNKSGRTINYCSSIEQFSVLELGPSTEAISIVIKLICILLPSLGTFYITYRVFGARRHGRKVDVQTQSNLGQPRFSTEHFTYHHSSKEELTAALLLGTYIICSTPFLIAVTFTMCGDEGQPFPQQAAFAIYMVFRVKGSLFPVIYIIRNRIILNSVHKFACFKFSAPVAATAFFVGTLPGHLSRPEINRPAVGMLYIRRHETVQGFKTFSRPKKVSMVNDFTDIN